METPQPNAAMRKKLVVEWEKLTDEEKVVKRAARSRQGVKCCICGKIGYYREICPNDCQSPPSTPNSLDSTPPSTPPQSPVGLGVFWGDAFSTMTDTSPKNRYDFKRKVDVNTVRPQAKIEQKKLQDSDANVGTFAFFAAAEEGYARSYPELTLHQVMRRMMRLLERQLHQNADKLEAAFDTTLLHPPVEKDRDTFYPPELSEVKAHRDYFLAKDLQKDRRLNHKNQASLRPEDQLDPLFRGGAADDAFLFRTDPKAGGSMHGKNTWKSVLSHSDGLASSDPGMARQQARIDKLFAEQGKWIGMQARSMTHRNDRFEHLVNILRWEMAAEHNRESRLLQATKHGRKGTHLALFQERMEAVDRVVLCLGAYNLTSGLEEADYLVFCLQKWKEALAGKIQAAVRGGGAGGGAAAGRGAATMSTSLSLPPLSESRPNGQSTNKKKTTTDSMAPLTSTTTGTATGTGSKHNTGSTTSKSAHGHNRMIASSSPYHADQVAVEQAQRKTQRLRNRFLADCAAAKEAAERTQTEGEKDEKEKEKRMRRKRDKARDSANHSVSFCSNLSLPAASDSVQRRGSVLQSHSGEGDEEEGVGADDVLQRSWQMPHHQASSAQVKLTGGPGSGSEGDSDGDGSDHHAHSKTTATRNKHHHSHSQSATPADSIIDQSLAAAMQHSQALADAAEDKRVKRQRMRNTSRAARKFTVVQRRHPREVDAEKMDRAKGSFIAAGIASHIRRGNDSDLACVAPALIPVPGAFDGDGRHPMRSHTAGRIVERIKKNMILGDLGYTPQSLLPLYVRNTLGEANGTTSGGDQTHEMMSTDRRYSHYLGRVLNRFEEVSNSGAGSVSGGGGDGTSTIASVSSSGYGRQPVSQAQAHTESRKQTRRGSSTDDIKSRMAPQQSIKRREKHGLLLSSSPIASTQEVEATNRRAIREQRRQLAADIAAAKKTPLTNSLVRLVFKNPEPTLNDLNYLDEW